MNRNTQEVDILITCLQKCYTFLPVENIINDFAALGKFSMNVITSYV